MNKPNTILTISDLKVAFKLRDEDIKAVRGIDFNLNRGEILGIVGESGSGKSVTALSLINLLPSYASIGSAQLTFEPNEESPVDLKSITEKRYRSIRGKHMSMVFQEPMTSLNPVYSCGNQVREMFVVHEGCSRKEANKRTIELFEKVQLPRPESIFHSYPHEISGGQKQRVIIAMAMACKPAVLIADEPTTALDVTVQKSILDLMLDLRDNYGTSIIFITHDLGVIAEIADRILVMYKGKIVEKGSVWDIFSNPKHPYTKGLLACRPRTDLKLNELPTIDDFMFENEKGEITEKPGKYKSVGDAILINVEKKDDIIKKRLKTASSKPLLKVKNLKKYYPIRKGVFGKIEGFVKAVDNVSFELYPGETIGLVGESGCGKTTLGRAILNLINPSDGLVLFEGQIINHLPADQMRKLRKEMQIIFQDPYSSLNPRKSIGSAILEPMQVHNLYGSGKARLNKVYELLETVNLSPDHYHRFPHEFSGGQRQRICIARALAVHPKFIICDESVSAYIFISHDLSVVKFMADRIFVMKDGKLVEMGYPDTLFERPKIAYTKNLIEAIPKGDLEDIRKAQLRRKLDATKN